MIKIYVQLKYEISFLKDGLSIGAAFTESALKGISICLAVICEVLLLLLSFLKKN